MGKVCQTQGFGIKNVPKSTLLCVRLTGLQSLLCNYVFFDIMYFRYEGLIRNNMMHGQGSYQWPNGDHYLGSYQQGLRNGYGEMIYRTKEERYKGYWLNGLYDGQGQYW